MAILIMTHTKNQTGIIRLCAKQAEGGNVLVVPEPDPELLYSEVCEADGKLEKPDYDAIDDANVTKLSEAIKESQYKMEDFTTVFIEANYQYPSSKHFVQKLFDHFLNNQGFHGDLVAVSATRECLKAASKHNTRIGIYWKVQAPEENPGFEYATTPQAFFKTPPNSKKKLKRVGKHKSKIPANKKNRTPEYGALTNMSQKGHLGGQSSGSAKEHESSKDNIRRLKTDPSQGFGGSILSSSSSDFDLDASQTSSQELVLPHAFHLLSISEDGSPNSKRNEKQPAPFSPLYTSSNIAKDGSSGLKLPNFPVSGIGLRSPQNAFTNNDVEENKDLKVPKVFK